MVWVGWSLIVLLFAFDLCIVVGLLFWGFGCVNFVFGLLLVLVAVVCVVVWLFWLRCVVVIVFDLGLVLCCGLCGAGFCLL